MENLYSNLTCSLFASFLFFYFFNKIKINAAFKAIFWVLVFLIVFFVKIDNLTLSNYVYGLSSTLSMTTVLLTGIYLIFIFFSKPYHASEGWHPGSVNWQINFNCLMIIIALSALVLYPWSLLNSTPFELYALGYNAIAVPTFYLLLSLGLVFYNIKYCPIFLLFALFVILYIFKIPNGDNFWNYFMDLFLVLYSLVFVGMKCIKNILSFYKGNHEH
jgi:hypothetical protein